LISQSVSQTVSQTVSQSDSQSVSQTVSQSDISVPIQYKFPCYFYVHAAYFYCLLFVPTSAYIYIYDMI